MSTNFLKIVLVGESGVGKTSIMNQYVDNRFDEHVKPTIGADFMQKDIIVGDRIVNLQIWDTSGKEEF